MKVVDLLTVKRICCGAHVASKKRALELLSQLLAGAGEASSETEIFDSLLSRERLGTTGLGHGVAIPHGRLASADAAKGAFVQLDQAIDYDAVDREPVDLLFGLVVPKDATEEHLQLLGQLAEMLRDDDLRRQLREARSADQLRALLEAWTPDGGARSARARGG